MNGIAWRAAIAIPVVVFLLVKGWQWPWALLFLAWTFHSIRSGTVFLIEPVEREKNPVTFSLISLLWLTACSLMFASDFFPR